MNLETISEYDLIGQEITVTQSKNKEIVGLKGKVIMETKNMITVKTDNGKKNIPKDICQFRDRKSTRLNSSHVRTSRMPSSA